MTAETRGTTALWLLVAMLVANHQECVRSQSTTLTTTGQAQTTQQQPPQQPSNLVQGAVNTLANGIPPANNPMSQQQLQQQQPQQQPLRVQANVTPQQSQPAQAVGQLPMQNSDGQLPMNVQPTLMVNGQPQPMQPQAYYNQQQQIPQQMHQQQQIPQQMHQQQQVPPQMHQQQQLVPPQVHQQQQFPPQTHQQNYQGATMQQPRPNLNPQPQAELVSQQQQWRPQTATGVPMMQQPQHLMQQHAPQVHTQQVPAQGQQYVQQLQQMPQKPMQMTVPQPQQSTMQYGGMQPVQDYQNTIPQQYTNQAYANVPTNAAGQPMQGGEQQLQSQTSSGPLSAAFTLLDPMPVARQALDTASSTMGSTMNMATGIKNGFGGAAVDITHKLVDVPEALIKGMFNFASALPSAVAGMKHKGIDTVASFLNLPSSRQQQQQQLQQQQLLQQQQNGYRQQANNAPPQYTASGSNPINAPQPIVRYNSMATVN